MKRATLLTALLLTGCLTQPEKKVRRIDCGTLTPTQDDWGEPIPETFQVTDSGCVRVENP